MYDKLTHLQMNCGVLRCHTQSSISPLRTPTNDELRRCFRVRHTHTQSLFVLCGVVIFLVMANDFIMNKWQMIGALFSRISIMGNLKLFEKVAETYAG